MLMAPTISAPIRNGPTFLVNLVQPYLIASIAS